MGFPTSPNDGDEYTNVLGTVYKYQTADDKWYIKSITEADLDHNSLGGLNDGVDYEHITQTQKDALHAEAHDLASHSTKAHSELSDAPTSAHHIKTVSGDIALNSLSEKDHVSLANKNAETDIKHLTDAQLGALHAKQHAMDVATEHTSSDVATLNANASKHGFLKKLDNVATNFMNGQGNWAVPAGGNGGGVTLPETFYIDKTARTTSNYGSFVKMKEIIMKEAFVSDFRVGVDARRTVGGSGGEINVYHNGSPLGVKREDITSELKTFIWDFEDLEIAVDDSIAIYGNAEFSSRTLEVSNMTLGIELARATM